MKHWTILLIIILCGFKVALAQKNHSDKNVLRPGFLFSYLPTWVLDDFEGNIPAKVIITGINSHHEIWKESVFIMGIAYGKMDVEEDEYKGIIVPLKLQKFFIPDRKGFNLSIGVLMSYCKTCRYQIGGVLSHEISYLFSAHPFKINVGLQLMEGALFQDIAIHLGGQVQVVWHPRE